MLLSSELVLYKKTYVTVNKSMNIIKFIKKKQKTKLGMLFSATPCLFWTTTVLQMPGEVLSIQKSKHNLFPF